MPQTEPYFRRAGLVKALLLLGISLLLIACETVGYYSQAARGQLAIVLGREEIQHLLADTTLSSELRQRFEEVLAIRAFAEQELSLPVGQNYSTYVDVEREHVVWNVFAAPEFSTNLLNWCYPIAGCVSYRGYFSEARAIAYADNLREDGFDVYSGGVDAYSTLGWFEDSLLSTVLNRDGYQLASLIFHELAHQLIYVPGDTTFNESFATAVEREGLRRWLRHAGQEALIDAAETDMARQQQFVDLVIDYRDRFNEVYAQPVSPDAMRLHKSRLQDELRLAYAELKQSWGGYAGYDNWFQNPLNNAQLSTVSSYNELVPYFSELVRQQNGDMRAFYRVVEELTQLTELEREQQLAALPGSAD
jgi:predicted aminopeptidase